MIIMDELEAFREELEALPTDRCSSYADGTLCTGSTVVVDEAVGLCWCERCDYRAEFLQWGYAHGWPALAYRDDEEAYSIEAGMFFWIVTALYGTDDRVLALYTAIETQQSA